MKPGEALKRSDAAIVGKLVKVLPRGDLKADFRYRVRSVYKGGRAIDLGRVISVRASTQSAACGLPREAGREYGLLLRQGEGRWWGGLCGLIDPRQLRSAARKSRTQRRTASGADLGCPS
jgi:hypothetical protein